MSGVYLVVSDTQHVLQCTKGGPPHITLIHTGKSVSAVKLIDLATMAFEATALQEFTLDRAYINSFEVEPGVTRHDVLLGVAEDGLIRFTRDTIIDNMREPTAKISPVHPTHVTARICQTEQEAEEYRATFEMPMRIKVIGVTIK